MKAQSASANPRPDAASPSKGISFQRDAMNFSPKLKRKMLTWAREENARTEDEPKEVQASATKVVIKLPKRTVKQTRGKKDDSRNAKAKGMRKAKAPLAIEKGLDGLELQDGERPLTPPPKKRKIEAGPAPKGGSEVEAETGRRRSQRIKAGIEVPAQRRSRGASR